MAYDNLPECFYRVSVKALVLNEAKDKFLITKEADGIWEIPGGGLDWGMEVHDELRREIDEEMGLEVTWIADNPCYFLTGKSRSWKGVWVVNILYEAELEHLNFRPSSECVEITFVNKDNLSDMTVSEQITQLAEKFEPENHLKK